MSKKRHILIVEDEVFLADAYKEALAGKGYEVSDVRNGLEALKWLKKETADLILLDLIMPKMTGFEFLEELKRLKHHAHVPVIVLTNLGQEKDREVCDSFGRCHYLIKTEVSLDDIVKEIGKSFSK